MKILSLLCGTIFLLGIIISGYYANIQPSFVTWFGVITAIVSPLAFELLLFPFRAKDHQLIKELSKVPKIESLIREAQDNEQKIKILEKQKRELDKLIAYESKRRSLEAEREIFTYQLNEVIKGMKRVNVELESLTHERQALPEEIKQLLDAKVWDGSDYIRYKIGDETRYLHRSSFDFFPFYGPLLFKLLKAFEQFFTAMEEEQIQK